RCFRAQFEFLVDCFHYFGVRLADGASCVHSDHATRFPLGDGMISVPDPGKESAVLLLEPVLVAAMVRGSRSVSPAGALNAVSDIGVHQDGQVGLQTAA